MKRVVRPEIFRNKRMTLRGITLFPFQSVGTEIPVHLRNSPSAEGWRLDFFPPFPMFGGERWSRAVAGFLFISYRIVQNGICSKLLWALLGFNFLETKQQQTAAISTIAKKAFPFDPEDFRNFQSEIFPKWNAPRAPSWVLGLQITVICEIVHHSTKAWTSFHCVICLLVGSECRKGLLCRSRRCYLLNRSILFQAFR